ncbi:glycoside hydrolase family 10 protein [Rubritalea marina]|uniref:glycoside hydrolase family 10 protein n=1 Tax=Rubritalea marina TaxID=361055 RepID=UPI0003829466|nr:family 10 glycosylhydrolase [Rubritalea marina]
MRHKLNTLLTLSILLCGALSAIAQSYAPSNAQPPAFPREFRAAWITTVYNIDWPSKRGLSASSQKRELLAILDKAAQLKLNAVIFQVRPNADAVYKSSLEPWSYWLTGTMGKSPGYDPLAFCIEEAHKRGIEVHAWFNPFRALPNKSLPTASNHVSRTHARHVVTYKNYKWLNPASAFSRDRALRVILDVVKRYDIDGVHLDDYFYPYPTVVKGKASPRFPDGKSNAQRRAYVDQFVSDLYRKVKSTKPWVRVGISPFGIWRPGVPSSIEAGIDAYDHLCADSRKWLQKGWVDYLAPQLYWQISPRKQSYTTLLEWWRQQGSRPVWPGIATARIKSDKDPSRRSSEIIKQVNYSRSIGRNWAGAIHWSMKSLMQNRDGISTKLQSTTYATPALVPPMPWISKRSPATPEFSARNNGGSVDLKIGNAARGTRFAIQARYNNKWYSIATVPHRNPRIKGKPSAIAVTSVDRYGNASKPRVLARR